MADYRSVFDMFDKDGDGSITTDELSAIFERLGNKVDNDKLDELVKGVDGNGDGIIDFNEFTTLMTNLVGTEDSEDDMREAFKLFDKDGNGMIDRAELSDVMKALGENMSDKELDDLMRAADTDGDGEISFEEFKKIMM